MTDLREGPFVTRWDLDEGARLCDRTRLANKAFNTLSAVYTNTEHSWLQAGVGRVFSYAHLAEMTLLDKQGHMPITDTPGVSPALAEIISLGVSVTSERLKPTET
jgi:hypothetical protein